MRLEQGEPDERAWKMDKERACKEWEAWVARRDIKRLKDVYWTSANDCTVWCSLRRDEVGESSMTAT